MRASNQDVTTKMTPITITFSREKAEKIAAGTTGVMKNEMNTFSLIERFDSCLFIEYFRGA